MASTYTSTIRLNKQGTGDNDGTWGALLNTQLDLLDVAINGYKEIAVVDGNNTVSIANGVADEGRYRVLQATGALTTTATLIYPDTQAFKLVTNYTTGNKSLVFRTSSGTGVTIPASTAMLVYSDGVSVRPVAPAIQKNGSIQNMTVGNLTVTSVSVGTLLTAPSASITNLVAASLTATNLVGTTGVFTNLDVSATVSALGLAVTRVATTSLVASVVSCNQIGVSAVDASKVSASTGYFGILRGGTVCINSALSTIRAIVTVSSPATSLSAGTGWAIGALVYTPKSTTSRLIIQAYVPMACTTGDSVLMSGIFWNGSSTNIDYAATYNAAISQTLQHSLVAELTPVTTGPITVSVRAAKTGLNTGIVNPSNSATKIFITEYNA